MHDWFALSHLALFLVTASFPTGADQATNVGFRHEDDQLVVTIGPNRIATYVYRDEAIPRPYFAHVRTLTGQQVTRHHPPIEGRDRTDHATMHPGIWLAFGDLNGVDFWRNRARIVHQSFAKIAAGRDKTGYFVQRKQYLRDDGSFVCAEVFKCSVHVLGTSYLLILDSKFRSDRQFYFGDQEEMGLGMRVATPIAEVGGGRMRDAEGRTAAKRIWGHAAAWCDYSGVVDGQPCGITLMCHPDNFRPSWMHARDYGLVAANPFGRQAMKKGVISKTVVQPGTEFRLRYAVWVHGGRQAGPADCAAAYRRFIAHADQ
jgi:hypothetical protein